MRVCAWQVCKYIDMPLQHINNLTLLAMNRPPAAHTHALLDKLRSGIPGLALRTTFISGAAAAAAAARSNARNARAAARRMQSMRCAAMCAAQTAHAAANTAPGLDANHERRCRRRRHSLQHPTGFPGESAEGHAELVEFLRSFRFERAGAFAYSEEDGTPAAELPGQVPPRIRCAAEALVRCSHAHARVCACKDALQAAQSASSRLSCACLPACVHVLHARRQRRRDELVQVQQRVTEAFAASLVGQELDVLVDGVNDDGWLFGRTQVRRVHWLAAARVCASS